MLTLSSLGVFHVNVAFKRWPDDVAKKSRITNVKWRQESDTPSQTAKYAGPDCGKRLVLCLAPFRVVIAGHRISALQV